MTPSTGTISATTFTDLHTADKKNKVFVIEYNVSIIWQPGKHTQNQRFFCALPSAAIADYPGSNRIKYRWFHSSSSIVAQHFIKTYMEMSQNIRCKRNVRFRPVSLQSFILQSK